MISDDKFKAIGERYGEYSSWAIWNPDDIRDTSVIDENCHELRTDVVMVGLNVSADVKGRWWRNFHMGPNDPKLRLAFNESRFRGAYMTDIVKSLVMVKAADVMKGIRRDEIDMSKHTDRFIEEMTFVGADQNSLFLVFGKDTGGLFEKHLSSLFPNFVLCEHFACYRKKEDWLRDIWAAIDAASPPDGA
ncbi:MAG: hypothetical protein WBD16_04915 [Pyrinomonadaceae bacterium]